MPIRSIRFALSATWMSLLAFALAGAIFLPSDELRGAPAAPDAPAESADLPAPVTLAEGRIEYTPPKDWTYSKASEKPNAHAYVSKSRKGSIAIQVWPANELLTTGMGPSIVKKLREARKKDNSEVMPATLEKDKRFAVRIHEQFKVPPAKKDDKGEQKEPESIDQLHLYRNVGPRVVMVTVSAGMKDPEEAKALLEAGEAVALSAKFIPPVKPEPAKKPKK